MPLRRIAVISALALSVLSLICPNCFAEASGPVDDKLRGELAAVLDAAGEGELVPVFFVLNDQLSGNKLTGLADKTMDKQTRRTVLKSALKRHAESTQQRLRIELKRAAEGGRAQRIRPLWIGNIVAADLTPALVRAFARFDEVHHVSHSPKVDVSLGPPMTRARLPKPLFSQLVPAGVGVDEVECGVDLMRAPEVWNDFGNTGSEAVIAVVDSGVCWYHPDIENQIWVNPGEDLDGDGVVMDADDENGIDDDGNGYIDDLIGYDIDNGDNDPNDDNSHGSHVAGSVAGDGTSGTQAGLAPDAGIMVIRVGLNFSDEPDVWEGMQYAADNGASAITMSLGWPHNQNPDRATWRTNCENTIDLGTAMVIAAGNEGSGSEPDNIRTPGDVPRIISVAAVNCSDSIASFSSRGPVTWQDVPEFGDHPYPPGLTKPDVAGPGVDTKSHNKCSGYSFKSGTSMATPHVAGAVALMITQNPGLEHDDLKMILEDTAVDLGDPGKDNVYGSGRVDAYEAVLRSGSADGVISVKEKTANCSSLLHVTVSDTDLKGFGTLDVEITSGSEPTAEVLTLTETSVDSGVFKGEINTDPGVPSADGLIQVVDADTVVATYIDADNGEGGTNIPKTDEVLIDCAAPIISGVHESDVDNSSATIRWTTDEGSTSEVDYGPSTPPDLQASSPGRVTSHAVDLTGLEECTVYYYQVTSEDALSNGVTDDNNGFYYRFETWGDFPDIGLAPCHQGAITLDREIYACSDEVAISVTDLDLNADSGLIESVSVQVTSSTEPEGEWVVLTEDNENSARFTGTVNLSGDLPVAGDGVLQAGNSDLLTASYHDEDDGTGASVHTSATATADCAAPAGTRVQVTRLTQSWAEIEWTSDEPSTSRVEYGPDAALGSVESDDALVTAHKLTIKGFDECQKVFFVVGGTDAYGNDKVIDADGVPFQMFTQQIPGLYYYDGFESAGEWILPGEWEIDSPAGLGGSPGNSDPAAAFAGVGVLGLDLTGQGSYQGDYEVNARSAATSARIGCSDCQNTTMIFWRHLNVEDDDVAEIAILSDGADTIWDNGGQTITESEWSEQRLDISGIVDGIPMFQLRFKIDADASGQYSGWNVDELVIKDGSLPDFSACGGCDASPSMAGLASLDDDDACASGGLTLGWDAAASWGTGDSGTYAVYRGTSPDFQPGSQTLVAQGLTGTTWVDADAPIDQQVWYIVRAENDEACGAGPNNNGVMDSNEVRLSATETLIRPPAGSVASSVIVDPVNHAHARLSWAATADTAFYRVYRSESPDMSGAVVLGETPGTWLEDRDALTHSKNYFYRVVSVNPCGEEEPN